MAEDGKIYITISDKRFGKNKAEADEQNNIDKEKEKKEPTLKSFAQHKFFNLIESQAKQAVSYTIGNIGNFTGDYIAQQGAATAMSFISDLTDIGMSIAAGSKFGVPGMIVAGAVTVISKVGNTAYSVYSGWVETSKRNRAIDQLRTRAGLNGTNNGSRGTDQ